MALIGTSWRTTSWVSAGGWAANTWAAAGAAVRFVIQMLTLSRIGD